MTHITKKTEENGGPGALAGEAANWGGRAEKSMVAPLKGGCRISTWSAVLLLVYPTKELGAKTRREACTHVHSSTIHDSPQIWR